MTVIRKLDTSRHGRRLAQRKRNPWFRFCFWRETRRIRRDEAGRKDINLHA